MTNSDFQVHVQGKFTEQLEELIKSNFHSTQYTMFPLVFRVHKSDPFEKCGFVCYFKRNEDYNFYKLLELSTLNNCGPVA